jgi:RNase P subunit RPR2
MFAEQLSCSSSVAFRFLHESLAFLNARRKEYICEDSNFDLEQIKQILSLMRRLTVFWTDVVTKQKAAKDLTTLLGSNHAHVLKVRRSLILREDQWRMAIYGQKITHESSRNDFEQVRERFMKATENRDPMKQTVAVAAHCDHVPETERAELLANAQTAKPILTKAAETRTSHRSNSLLGAAFSFGGDQKRAECLLEKVHHQPNVEVCPENRIHQLLIYAEHKTRDGSWDIARLAMREIREIWQGSEDSLPENLKRYFKPRVRNVLRAISSRLTVDDAAKHGFTSLSNRQGSPVPSLESSMTSSSPDSDMPDDFPRTPSIRAPSPSTAVRPTDSPGSFASQFWNDALRSPSPKTGKELGNSLKELSLTEETKAPHSSVPGPDIQSTTSPSGRLPDNLASTTEVEWDPSWPVHLGISSPAAHNPSGGLSANQAQEEGSNGPRNAPSASGAQQDVEMADPQRESPPLNTEGSVVNAWLNEPPVSPLSWRDLFGHDS